MPLQNAVGSRENPITSKSPLQALENRGYKYCLCDECNQVHRCTPSNDYYICDADGKLRCEGCFRGHHGLKTVTRQEPDKKPD